MTPRERFLKVFAGEMPDRAPVTLFIVDQGHFLNQMYPAIDAEDYLTLQLKVIELQRQLKVDVFVRLLFGLADPFCLADEYGLDVSHQTEDWEVCREEIRRDNSVITRSTIRTPDGTLTQETSRTELRPGTFVYACNKKPIKTPADLDMAIKYEPRMRESFKKHALDWVQTIKTALGDDGIIGSWGPQGPFNTAASLFDQSELYTLFLTDYPFYERLMNFAIDRMLDYLRAYDAAGVDVHCIGGNVPGGFLGRRCYDQYILPFEKKFIDYAQENGTPAMYHNCGRVMSLVESYKELGARIVEPFSPPPLGDANLARVKEIVGDSYVILGGVDQVNVLQKGTVEQVKRITEATMKTGKPGGRFLIQSADLLEYGTPVENIEAYVETALQHAAY
ncbi:MAG: hypothetical protein IT426_17965 [Pirellulales bacterium]|nr:hypothetical protein [Pirellulales bacterium]